MLVEPKYDDADYWTAEAVAEVVFDDLPLFVQQHNGNGRLFVSWQLIKYHTGVHRARAEDAKRLVDAHVSDEELEDAFE